MNAPKTLQLHLLGALGLTACTGTATTDDGPPTGEACDDLPDLLATARSGTWPQADAYTICLDDARGSAACEGYADDRAAAEPVLQAALDDALPPVCTFDTGQRITDTGDCRLGGFDVTVTCGPDAAQADCCFSVSLAEWAIGRPFHGHRTARLARRRGWRGA